MSIQRENFWQVVQKQQLWIGGILLLSAVSLFFVTYNPFPRGLKGKYYTNPDWRGTPQVTVRDESISLNRVRQAMPDFVDNYGIEWSGSIFIPTTGIHTFSTYSDDGSELWIDDVLVVDNRGFHGGQERFGTIELQRGLHKLILRYMQGGGGADLAAHWTPPGGPEKYLDEALLFTRNRAKIWHVWYYYLRRITLPVLAALWEVGLLALALMGGAHILVKSRFWQRRSAQLVPFRAALYVLLLLLVILLNVWLGYAWLKRPLEPYWALQLSLSLLLLVLGIASLGGVLKAFISSCVVHPHSAVVPAERSVKHGQAWGVSLVFLLLFGVGAGIVGDYGIAYDEVTQHRIGLLNVRYVFEHDPELLAFKDKYYGPFFEMLLVLVEQGFRLTDSRQVYLMRHSMTFLLFYAGVIAFYCLCRERFNSWKIGLIGSSLLVLSPRIFADAFYNPKDLPFLSVFIISVYTLTKYFDRPNWLNALVHAVVCGILIDIRILGVLVPAWTIFWGIGDLLLKRHVSLSLKRPFVRLCAYSIITGLTTFVFFPILWEAPLENFMEALRMMQKFPWGGGVTYLGEHRPATDLPWHYLPVWIVVSTPVLYLGTFLMGLINVIGTLFRGEHHLFSDRHQRLNAICLLWFFIPLLLVIGLRSIVYDGWRHLYFIYPALLLIGLSEGVRVYETIRATFAGRRKQWVSAGLLAVGLWGVAVPASFMLRFHPYQHLYFNLFAGKNRSDFQKYFEFDYWGLAYRQAFEYIARHDKRDRIKVVTANLAPEAIVLILPAEDRQRLVPSEAFENADYFVSNYRGKLEDYDLDQEVYAIFVDGLKIMVVYKLRHI